MHTYIHIRLQRIVFYGKEAALYSVVCLSVYTVYTWREEYVIIKVALLVKILRHLKLKVSDDNQMIKIT